MRMGRAPLGQMPMNGQPGGQIGGPGFGPAPGPKPRRGILKGCLIAVAVVMAIVLIAVGIFLYRVLPPGTGDHGRLTFHPQAPDGAWLSADYANGAEMVDLGGEIQAVTSDQKIAVISLGSAVSPVVAGIDLASRETVWEQPLLCSTGSFMVDEAFCFWFDDEVGSQPGVVRVDLVTGETTDWWAATGLLNIEYVGRDGDNLIVFLGETLASVRPDGEANWTVEQLPQTFPTCEIIGEVIGCQGYDEYQVLDLATGQPRTPITTLDEESLAQVYWGTDGYSVGPSTTVARRVAFRVYDYQGNEIADTVNSTPPLTPGTDRNFRAPRVYYPTADLIDGDKVAAIDAAGRVIVSGTRFNDGIVFQASGEKLSGSVRGVSADGQFVAIDGVDVQPDGFYNAQGELLHEVQVSWLGSGVLGGFIVGDNWILLPN